MRTEAMTSAMQIPTTRAQAVQLLVEQSVAEWGAAEREAAERLHGEATLGLAINTLAQKVRLDHGDDSDLYARWMEAAQLALTESDWDILRQGG